ncbi:hypothetical protein ABI59_20325 [Acidobacteria bacterium Mor1]|nr:hypothetical protein ABI59_20325 [Acidobacteria bacterium Mor1]
MSRNAEISRERLAELLERTSRTFALSIPLLREPTRHEVELAYLLFRIADTLEDATLWSKERQVDELNAFADLLRKPSTDEARRLADRWSAEPPLEHDDYMELMRETPLVIAASLELAPAALEQVLPHTIRTTELMAGFCARQNDDRVLELESIDELKRYCYAVAGIVGEMLTELFILGAPPLQDTLEELRSRAATFGEALQLVNILKDTATDVVEGRDFLGGCDRGEVFALARRDLAVAQEYVELLRRHDAPRGTVEFTALPVLLAWATLDAVEEHGPGAKISRLKVAGIVAAMKADLTLGKSPFR